MMCGDKEGS